MRKAVFVLLVIFGILAPRVFAQVKFGYVDSETILDQLQDAQDARQQLDQLIQEWQSELTRQEREWKTKYDDYDKRKLIMSEAARTEIEADLVKIEQKISEYREKKFGTNGELFTKQEEVMKPIQNKVFTIIKKVASEEDFDFVFDRSGGTLVLFAKDKYDITNLVMKALKINPPNSGGAPGVPVIPNQPPPKDIPKDIPQETPKEK